MNDDMFETFPVIGTDRLVLRDVQPGDAAQFFKIRSDAQVMAYMDRPLFQSLDEAEKLVDSSIEGNTKKRSVNWVITEKGRDILIGYVAFWRWVKEHFRAEIGFALFPGYWGKGFMSEALEAAIGFGFGKMGLLSIEANVNPGNAASIKLLEKLGFKKEAYLRENMFFNGKFVDSVIYSLLEKDRK